MVRMKYILVSFIFVLIANLSFSSAQNDLSAKATARTNYLTKELQLTNDQNEKVSTIVFGVMMKNDGIKNASNMSQEEKEKAYRSNKQAEIDMLKNVLTPDQMNKFIKLEADKY